MTPNQTSRPRVPVMALLGLAFTTLVVVALLIGTRLGLGNGANAAGQPGLQAGPASLNGIVPTLPGQVPSYTVADVRAWLAAHPGRPDTVNNVPPTLQSIQFVTAAQASQLLQGDSIGSADIVCVVTFTGEFPGSDVPGPGPVGTPFPTPTGTPQYYTVSRIIFDGKTGAITDESLQYS